MTKACMISLPRETFGQGYNPCPGEMKGNKEERKEMAMESYIYGKLGLGT